MKHKKILTRFVDVLSKIAASGYGLVLLCLAFLLAKAGTLGLPFFWDEIPSVIRNLGYSFARKTLFLSLMQCWTNFFGHAVPVYHILPVLIGLAAIIMTYKLADLLFDKKTAFCSGVLLAFSPLFFAQSGLVNPAIFMSMTVVAAVYFLCNNQTVYFFMSLAAVVLGKENGLIIATALMPALLFQCLLENKGKQDLLLKAFFGVILIGSLCLIILGLIKDTTLFFYMQKIKLIDLRNIKKIISTLIGFIIACPLMYLGIAGAMLKGGFSKSELTNQRKLFLFAFALLFLSQILFYSIYAINLPRYWLVLYPPMAIMAAFLLMHPKKKDFRSKAFIGLSVGVLCLLCFFPFSQNRAFGSGAYLEQNMSYVSAIKTHERAIAYLENKYPDAIIGTAWPFLAALRYPELGYVKKPLKARRPFDKPFADPDQSIFSTADEYFDIILYSPQSDNSHKIKKYIDKYQWQLDRRFTCRGNLTEIYKKRKINQ